MAAALFSQLQRSDKVKVLAVGDKAPDFELVDLEGNKHRLSDYRGEGVFLISGVHGADLAKQKCLIWKISIKSLKDKGVHILAINLKDTRIERQRHLGISMV